jgi:maltose O-acetyltransferase
MLGTIKTELSIFFTNLLMNGLNLWGPGSIGCKTRAFVLRKLGYQIGTGVRLSTDISIHSRHKHLSIGDKTFINKRVIFDTLAPVTIGKGCDIGFYSIFTTSQHALLSDYKGSRPASASKPILIEDFVWIGCNVTVLGGVTIGKGSVVAAGSVVTKDIPPNSLAMGIPARVVRALTASTEGVVEDITPHLLVRQEA